MPSQTEQHSGSITSGPGSESHHIAEPDDSVDTLQHRLQEALTLNLILQDENATLRDTISDERSKLWDLSNQLAVQADELAQTRRELEEQALLLQAERISELCFLEGARRQEKRDQESLHDLRQEVRHLREQLEMITRSNERLLSRQESDSSESDPRTSP